MEPPLNSRLSYRRGTARHFVIWNRQLLHNCTKNPNWKGLKQVYYGVDWKCCTRKWRTKLDQRRTLITGKCRTDQKSDLTRKMQD